MKRGLVALRSFGLLLGLAIPFQNCQTPNATVVAGPKVDYSRQLTPGEAAKSLSAWLPEMAEALCKKSLACAKSGSRIACNGSLRLNSGMVTALAMNSADYPDFNSLLYAESMHKITTTDSAIRKCLARIEKTNCDDPSARFLYEPMEVDPYRSLDRFMISMGETGCRYK